jgi:hypothetical protein
MASTKTNIGQMHSVLSAEVREEQMPRLTHRFSLIFMPLGASSCLRVCDETIVTPIDALGAG